MKPHTRLTACVLALAMATAPMTSHADWIGDFYSSAGAAVNVTTPQAISSQSVVGMSGGGLSWRVPSKNFQPFQITPPSLKSGCGGIDAYLGAYSFPNKQAFVEALRNFGQAAIGYFFELALRTMAPEIAVTLDVINDLATRVNQFSMNSCNAAKQAVDSIAGTWMRTNARDASGYARSVGQFLDQFDADYGIDGNGAKIMENKYLQNYGKPRSELTSADAGKSLPGYVNVLRYALDHSNASTLDEPEKELIMSLVGPTLILRPGTANDGTEAPEVGSVAKTIDFKQLVGEHVLTVGPTAMLSVVKCDSLPECLYPTTTNQVVQTFSQRAMAAITRIRSNVSTNTSGTNLTADHKLVLKMSSVPIYRAAAMAESSGVAAIVAGQLVYDLADYAALDAASNMVNYYLAIVDKALEITGPKVPLIFQSEVLAMRTRISDIRTQMHEQIRYFYQVKGNPYEKIDQLDKVERAMYTNLNATLAANARFGKRQ